jgi:hypothetical protein
MSFGRGVVEPNKNVVDWARLLGKPANLSVVGEVGEETIVDAIEEAAGTRRSRLGPRLVQQLLEVDDDEGLERGGEDEARAAGGIC